MDKIKSFDEYEKIWESRVELNPALQPYYDYLYHNMEMLSEISGEKEFNFYWEAEERYVKVRMDSGSIEYVLGGKGEHLPETNWEDPIIITKPEDLSMFLPAEVEEADELKFRDDLDDEDKPSQKKINELDEKVKEYKSLSTNIDTITQKFQDMLEKELKDLPDRLDEIKQNISEDIEKLKIQKLKTDGVVISFRKAYTQPSVKYKPLWTEALTKVNDQTRKVLEGLVSDFSGETNVRAKVDIKRESLEVNEGILDNIKSAIKKGISYVTNMIRGGVKEATEEIPEWDEATDDLERVTAQIEEYEQQERDRELPRDMYGY